jgi:threonine synthase
MTAIGKACEGVALGRAHLYVCIRCGTSFPFDVHIDSRGCPHCFADAASNLQVISTGGTRLPGGDTPSLWRYADRLPCEIEKAISLGEGLTPLLRADRLGQEFGLDQLYIKDESRNPTWSHKDRFSTVAVSMARLSGARVVATASSGNAGASLAAYAAKGGLDCVVVTFAGIGTPMLAQVRKYGATVLTLANKADRWPLLQKASHELGWFVTSPFHEPAVGSHPAGIAGYKTLAYEIVAQLGGIAPDWCALPVCYGDALVGLWQGFAELLEAGEISALPRFIAAEVHGSLGATLKVDSDVIVEAPAKFETLAVSIGAKRSTYQALAALRASNGVAVSVDNNHLIALQEELARREGILAELASVTPLSAIASLKQRGIIAREDKVVAIVTASGLKDLDRSAEAAAADPKPFVSVHDAMAWLEGLHRNNYFEMPV